MVQCIDKRYGGKLSHCDGCGRPAQERKALRITGVDPNANATYVVTLLLCEDCADALGRACHAEDN